MRVFVHSASGQVTEQDLATEEDVKKTAEQEQPVGVVERVGVESVTEPSSSHEDTTTKSEDTTTKYSETSMDLTCVGGASKYEEEPYVEQVSLVNLA